MGVSGTGKSTLGRALSESLAWRFVEGDDFHPRKNVEKMSRGEPLNNDDRIPWLDQLNREIENDHRQGVRSVVACSALKKCYRDRLIHGLDGVQFVFLCGTRDVILNRLRNRRGHFMPPDLLDSQIAALEPPEDAIFVPVELSTEEQVETVVKQLSDVSET
jgi:carbohydrate kinase (thermoresistant glucokinase family)